jgi:allantoate deiminase
VAIYREGEPYFLVGSHLDTVVRGGAFDGVAGVLGAMEVARLAADSVDRGLRVVAFAGEEGARFGRPNLGSAAAAGMLTEESVGRLRDAHGTDLATAAAELGLEPLATEPWIGDRISCFFELHIEQGRQLEAGSARIGLVDAIAGSVRLRFEITGRSDHSGATPMRMRSDALAAASELVLVAEEVGRRYRSTVATVGRIEVHPNNVTTVPGEVSLWMDIRDVDADLQRQAAAAIFERARELGERREVGIAGELISDQAPVVLAAWPRMIAHRECAERGLTYRVLASGAGHDAAIVARRAPATMFFIPCLEGLSHSPREQASVEDIAAASELISAVLVDAAESNVATGG